MVMTVGTFEAKTRLSELLDRVESGDIVAITRRGVEIARLVPADRRCDPGEVVETFEKIRRDVLGEAPVELAEVASWRLEGQR
ncbi:MAG: type II toxin-antitoxin system prevent-host-death family antitoxin [Propionibacteriaceae bacterium]|jgi:prevent-host-death family protein|nr:type II toxin-antitoxin system prevent-host-death family antitoxin [Propionibacteriaceae bacterium]